jgi:hypothetical protein
MSETETTGSSVWLVQNASGWPHAIFATEALANQWIADNPSANLAPPMSWHLHGAEDQRAQSEPAGGIVGYVVAEAGGPSGWALDSAGMWTTRADAEQERDDVIASLPRDYQHEYAVCAVVRLEEPRGRTGNPDA